MQFCNFLDHALLGSVVVKTFFRSRDQDRDLDKMNSSALESRDHGLEITALLLGPVTLTKVTRN